MIRLPDPVAGVVLGVVGGSGGVGASTLAALLALCAGRCVLIDLDQCGGGIDVLLGIESVPGARWSGLRLAGGHLDPQALATGLPRWRGLPVLAADVGPPTAEAVGAVIDAARSLGSVVLALPRAGSPAREAAVAAAALTIVVVRGDVGGVTAAGAVVLGLADAAVAAVVWERELSGSHAADLTGVPLLAAARIRRVGPVRGGRPPRRLLRLAAGIVDGVANGAA